MNKSYLTLLTAESDEIENDDLENTDPAEEDTEESTEESTDNPDEGELSTGDDLGDDEGGSAEETPFEPAPANPGNVQELDEVEDKADPKPEDQVIKSATIEAANRLGDTIKEVLSMQSALEARRDVGSAVLVDVRKARRLIKSYQAVTTQSVEVIPVAFAIMYQLKPFMDKYGARFSKGNGTRTTHQVMQSVQSAIASNDIDALSGDIKYVEKMLERFISIGWADIADISQQASTLLVKVTKRLERSKSYLKNNIRSLAMLRDNPHRILNNSFKLCDNEDENSCVMITVKDTDDVDKFACNYAAAQFASKNLDRVFESLLCSVDDKQPLTQALLDKGGFKDISPVNMNEIYAQNAITTYVSTDDGSRILISPVLHNNTYLVISSGGGERGASHDVGFSKLPQYVTANYEQTSAVDDFFTIDGLIQFTNSIKEEISKFEGRVDLINSLFGKLQTSIEELKKNDSFTLDDESYRSLVNYYLAPVAVMVLHLTAITDYQWISECITRGLTEAKRDELSMD